MALINLDLHVKTAPLHVKSVKIQPLHVSAVVPEITCIQINAQLSVHVDFMKMLIFADHASLHARTVQVEVLVHNVQGCFS